MATRTSNPLGFLGERLRNLQLWLAAALEIYELRDAETVRKAKEQFLKWACESWDGGSGDVDGALAFACEGYIESGPNWVNDARSFHADFPVVAEPPWELMEFHLLVASTLADHAVAAFELGTKRQTALAAILYADAVEVREHWQSIRGPAEARNKEAVLGLVFREMDEALKRRELAQVRTTTARAAAMTKLAKDPKQAAKVEAKKLWQDWQAGSTLHKSNAAFARFVCDMYPVLESPTNVERWARKWSGEKSKKALS